MSLAPFRGRCMHCGHDHGNGVFDLGGYKPIPLTETQMAELFRLRAELATLQSTLSSAVEQRDDLLAAIADHIGSIDPESENRAYDDLRSAYDRAKGGA